MPLALPLKFDHSGIQTRAEVIIAYSSNSLIRPLCLAPVVEGDNIINATLLTD